MTLVLGWYATVVFPLDYRGRFGPFATAHALCNTPHIQLKVQATKVALNSMQKIFWLETGRIWGEPAPLIGVDISSTAVKLDLSFGSPPKARIESLHH